MILKILCFGFILFDLSKYNNKKYDIKYANKIIGFIIFLDYLL